MNLLAKIDGSFAVTRPLWLWLGQVALVILGTHLAADHLDDLIGPWLADVPVPWPDPQTPFVAATWVAVAIELLVTVWAVRTLARTADQRVTSVREWWSRRSIHNLAAPLFWLPVSLAGSWSLAMAVEDLLAFAYGREVGFLVGGLVALRLASTGFLKLVLQAPAPIRRTDGWRWLPALVSMGGLAARHGLPVWGWL